MYVASHLFTQLNCPLTKFNVNCLPFGSVTVENFGRPGLADYRNPNLAEALKVLGFVQRFGVGIALARKALEENGSTPPEFEVRPEAVNVVLRARV